MDAQVDGVGDQQVGDVGLEAFARHRRVHREAAEHALGRIGMDRAHRAVVALRHRQQHRQDLLTADLADDHPIGVHAKRLAHELGEGELRRSFGVGLPGLEAFVVGVEIVEPVEPDLE
jgi:hypothetical protein